MMTMTSSNGSGRSSNSNSSSSCTRYPFTSIQWQELEHQALVYKHMVSGIPIPPDLLFSIRRSYDSSSKFLHLHHQSPIHHVGWSSGSGSGGCYGQYPHHQMGYGMMMRKIDPEPGRCRRTDGKKWRCSKEAYPDSKYCERHMHRGRNRSRKPVEIISTPPTNASTCATSTSFSFPMYKNKNSNTHSCTSNTNNNTTGSNISFLSSSGSAAAQSHESHHFLYPQVPLQQHVSRPQESNTTTNFFLDSSSVNPHSRKDYYSTRNMFGQGFKEEETSCNEHHPFLSEVNCKSVSDYSTWKLAPGVMGYMTDNNNSNLNRDDGEDQYQNHPKKVMHHFLDEWPPQNDKDSTEDTLSSSTHLSISAPNPLHDFFITNKW